MPDLAVVGAGVMGAGIAQSAAIVGLSAVMVDVQDAALARGRETIEKDLERRLKRGRLSEEGRDEVLARISTATSLEACADVPLVIEAIVENLEIRHSSPRPSARHEHLLALRRAHRLGYRAPRTRGGHALL